MKAGAFLLSCLLAAPSFAQDDSFELVRFDQTTNSLDWVTFSGSVLNTGSHIEAFPAIIITVKLSKKVVGVFTGFLDTPTVERQLSPGEEGLFEVPTTILATAFDELVVRFSSRPDALDPSFATGDLVLIDESLNAVENFAGDIQLLGEFRNDTNAVLGELSIRFRFFNADGDFIGSGDAFFGFAGANEMLPGAVFAFTALGSVPFADVDRWEVDIEYVPLRLGFEDVATAVADATWGELKRDLR